MERIILPEPAPLTLSLDAALAARRSGWSCDPTLPITLTECGTLFGHALKKRPNSMSRQYPSGGALYPIETYFITTALENRTPGIFHYHPTAHALEHLWDLPRDFVIKDLVKRPAEVQFSSLIIFSAVWQRSAAKYGDFAYTLALLEAGHMSENILLVATALGLSARPMAGFNDDALMKLLDFDGKYEQPVHSITIGKKSSTHDGELQKIGDE